MIEDSSSLRKVNLGTGAPKVENPRCTQGLQFMKAKDFLEPDPRRRKRGTAARLRSTAALDRSILCCAAAVWKISAKVLTRIEALDCQRS